MEDLDGAKLRQQRQQAGASQARVARAAGVSAGHIVRVEAGERAPSPAVVNGYEKVLGVSFSGPTWMLDESGGDTLTTYRSSPKADPMQRRALIAALASIAAGGPLGEPIGTAVAALGPTEVPSRVGLADVIDVERAADMFTTWDLRFGGGLAREMARAQLQWATGLLEAQMSDPVRIRLFGAVGSLAERAAWATFDAGDHGPARRLFRIALHTASQADDADLVAHILSDVATQQMYLGHPDDGVRLVRLAAGDDRISPAVRFVLHGVQARAHGELGEAEPTVRHIGLAEQQYADVTEDNLPAWMRQFLTDAHVFSVTGQAAFSLARTTGVGFDDAAGRLKRALVGFGPGRARAVALCATRLATLHLHAGHHDDGVAVARTALSAAPGLRSARILADLDDMRQAAAEYPQTRDFAEEIATAFST